MSLILSRFLSRLCVDSEHQKCNGFAPSGDCKCFCHIKDDKHVDDVHHPPHYNKHLSGVECIQITEHMNFNLGNAIKYIWRAGLKSEDIKKDLEKAKWYIEREIKRIEQELPF